MPMLAPDRLEAAYQTALAALLAERAPAGHWVGELSTSALSTATAVMALHLVAQHGGAAQGDLVAGGLRWLVAHQNADGGWGDTVKSFSNISTTMLCRSAFYLTGMVAEHAPAVARAEAWLAERYGAPAKWPEAVRARYGKDRTFAVPILTTCALAGLVSWGEVPALPFELACLPQAWFRFVRLHVVSYALPALIAIGQAIYHHRPPRNPLARLVRAISRKRSLRVLEKIQPSSGGFLEATPLTSFVTLSLASIGHARHSVAVKGVEFLVRSVLPDGSWAIDSNLATWVTTLSINALAAAGELQTMDRREQVRDWLLGQQYKEVHPYTGAEPGGWAWTDLPGGVPDADDTPGAMLACSVLSTAPQSMKKELSALLREMVRQLNFMTAGTEPCSAGGMVDVSALPNQFALHMLSGLSWLSRLQNGDGGWPTFCRGWGHLPFDRSGCDLTAHALRALAAWKADVAVGWFSPAFSKAYRAQFRRGRLIFALPSDDQMKQAIEKGFAYLARTQRPGGSWLPLWFGNQHAPDDENPTYGTARVLAAYRDLDRIKDEPAQQGIAWLLRHQNADGGWGGCLGTPSSMEETALAVEILVDVANPPAGEAVNNGLAWLVEQVERGGLHNPTPIGFYFAKLWYFEKLYPIIFSVAALGRARLKLSQTPGSSNRG
jgi:squalene-hopene/tetraprenyl-beta-curcumene cyclase